MKGILGLLKAKYGKSPEEAPESAFFTTAFMGQGVDDALLIPWEARATEIGAKRLPKSRGGKLLEALWSKDKYMSHLDQDAVERMERFFQFASVPPNRDVIRQGEYGNFMVVLLNGTIAVGRLQPWGEQLRLAETRPGDILGEMSLLDSGIRFSSCTTLTDCELAALNAEAMDEMKTKDPQLAASLVALLARKLSQRLRVVSARLSDHQN